MAKNQHAARLAEIRRHYIAIDGSVGQFEIGPYLFVAHELPVLERYLVAQALNEHFMALSVDIRMSYSSGIDPVDAADPEEPED